MEHNASPVAHGSLANAACRGSVLCPCTADDIRADPVWLGHGVGHTVGNPKLMASSGNSALCRQKKNDLTLGQRKAARNAFAASCLSKVQSPLRPSPRCCWRLACLSSVAYSVLSGACDGAGAGACALARTSSNGKTSPVGDIVRMVKYALRLGRTRPSVMVVYCQMPPGQDLFVSSSLARNLTMLSYCPGWVPSMSCTR